MSKYGEPWKMHTDDVVTCSDGLAPDSRKRAVIQKRALRSRAVQCVNALAGVDDPKLFVEAAKQVIHHLRNQDVDTWNMLGIAVAEMEAALAE